MGGGRRKGKGERTGPAGLEEDKVGPDAVDLERADDDLVALVSAAATADPGLEPRLDGARALLRRGRWEDREGGGGGGGEGEGGEVHVDIGADEVVAFEVVEEEGEVLSRFMEHPALVVLGS